MEIKTGKLIGRIRCDGCGKMITQMDVYHGRYRKALDAMAGETVHFHSLACDEKYFKDKYNMRFEFGPRDFGP